MKTKWEWTRINNDINGNSRYVVHFLPLVGDLILTVKNSKMTIEQRYKIACKRANKLGGRKFHNKSYGGGIVFQAYESQLPEIEDRLIAMQDMRQKFLHSFQD